MPLVYGRIGGETVQVFFAFDIPHPDALAPVEDHVQGLVIVRTEFIFQFDIVCG
jgi:hypothetical protein